MTRLSRPDTGDRGPGASTGDTIEVEISSKDILTPPPATASTDRSGATPDRHWPLKGVGLAIVTAAAIVTFASVAHHGTTPVAPPLPIVAQVSKQIATPEPTVSTEEPVHFKNPFDRSETFDFPAGTTQADARQAVAELLLQRASERRQAMHAGGVAGGTGGGRAAARSRMGDAHN